MSQKNLTDLQAEEQASVSSPLRRSSRITNNSSPIPSSITTRRASQTESSTVNARVTRTRRASQDTALEKDVKPTETKSAALRGRRASANLDEPKDVSTPKKTRSRTTSAVTEVEKPEPAKRGRKPSITKEAAVTEEPKSQPVTRRRRSSVLSEDEPPEPVVKIVRMRRGSNASEKDEPIQKPTTRTRRASINKEEEKVEAPKKPATRGRKNSGAEEAEVLVKKPATRGRRTSTEEEPEAKVSKIATKPKRRLSITENITNLESIEEHDSKSNSPVRELEASPVMKVTPIKKKKPEPAKSDLNLSIINETSLTENTSLVGEEIKEKPETPRKSPRLNKEVMEPKNSPVKRQLDMEVIVALDTTKLSPIKSIDSKLTENESNKSTENVKISPRKSLEKSVKQNTISVENKVSSDTTDNDFSETKELCEETVSPGKRHLEDKDMSNATKTPRKSLEDKQANTHNSENIELVTEKNIFSSNGNDNNISMGSDGSFRFHLNVSIPSVNSQNLSQENVVEEQTNLNLSKSSSNSDKENASPAKTPGNKDNTFGSKQENVINFTDVIQNSSLREEEITHVIGTSTVNVFKPLSKEQSFFEPMEVDATLNKTVNLDESNLVDASAISTPKLNKSRKSLENKFGLNLRKSVLSKEPDDVVGNPVKLIDISFNTTDSADEVEEVVFSEDLIITKQSISQEKLNEEAVELESGASTDFELEITSSSDEEVEINEVPLRDILQKSPNKQSPVKQLSPAITNQEIEEQRSTPEKELQELLNIKESISSPRKSFGLIKEQKINIEQQKKSPVKRDSVGLKKNDTPKSSPAKTSDEILTSASPHVEIISNVILSPIQIKPTFEELNLKDCENSPKIIKKLVLDNEESTINKRKSSRKSKNKSNVEDTETISAIDDSNFDKNDSEMKKEPLLDGEFTTNKTPRKSPRKSKSIVEDTEIIPEIDASILIKDDSEVIKEPLLNNEESTTNKSPRKSSRKSKNKSIIEDTKIIIVPLDASTLNKDDSKVIKESLLNNKEFSTRKSPRKSKNTSIVEDTDFICVLDNSTPNEDNSHQIKKVKPKKSLDNSFVEDSDEVFESHEHINKIKKPKKKSKKNKSLLDDSVITDLEQEIDTLAISSESESNKSLRKSLNKSIDADLKEQVPQKNSLIGLDKLVDLKLNEFLSEKIKELETEESESENEVDSFLNMEAEEGEEDTPSENSNDIIDEGESINSTDSIVDSDDDYENDSFVCDDEVEELLSGSEYDLDQDEIKPKKSRILKISDDENAEIIIIKKKDKVVPESPKKSRIITVSDTSEDEENEKTRNQSEKKSDVKEVTAQSINIESPAKQSVEKLEKSSENPIATELIHNEPQKSSQETLITTESKDESIALENIDNSLNASVSGSTMEAKKRRSSHKRSSSITILENIKVDEIKDNILSERINVLVNSFCSGIQKGEISLNLSLEHAEDSSEEHPQHVKTKSKKTKTKVVALDKNKDKESEESKEEAMNDEIKDETKYKESKEEAINDVIKDEESEEEAINDEIKEENIKKRLSVSTESQVQTESKVVKKRLSGSLESLDNKTNKDKKKKKKADDSELLEPVKTNIEIDFPKPRKAKKRKHVRQEEDDVANLRADTFSILNQLVNEDIKNRKRRMIKPSTEIDSVSWVTEVANVKPSTTVITKKDKATYNLEKFDSRDFKNRMLYDSKRINRVDTKTLLKKKGAYQ